MQDVLTPGIALAAGGVIAAIGVLLLAWGLRMRADHRRRLARDHRTTGTVVENRLTTDAENSTLVYPIVEFTTASPSPRHNSR